MGADLAMHGRVIVWLWALVLATGLQSAAPSYGESAPSNEVSFVYQGQPVEIAWDALTQPVTVYRIWWGTAPGRYFRGDAVGPPLSPIATKYTFNLGVPGTRYYLMVTAQYACCAVSHPLTAPGVTRVSGEP